MWRCPWRACHDHSQRYDHGYIAGSVTGHERRRRAYCAIRTMKKQEVRQRIEEIGIVPVIRASSSREAKMAADAVCAGGITVVEITMTVPGAVDVIGELAKTSGTEILIGAGTVLDAEAARRCLDAGAQFLVSPGL